tara:strand:+ start:286 stop:948 length:663 start_codon:yes stop_codon:yes gene_type:complete
MLLITETNTEDVRLVTEATEDGKKNYFIEGVFMQANKPNRNNRIYERNILFGEAKRYIKTYVDENRAFGELNHPQGPTVNLDRVSHIIKEMREDGDNLMGKAKIMDTPMGKIVQNLVDEGAKLGVSSRGMGSLKERNGINEVQKDFMLSAVDIVADPSAPDAFVNGIMEGREWIWDNGILKEKDMQSFKENIESAYTTRQNREEKLIEVYADFMSKLKNV